MRAGAAAGVVFVTAHERYAVEAFAVEAFDYLLKPVDPERLARVVERLRERGRARRPRSRRSRSSPAGGTELIDLEQMHFVQADGDYCRVHTYDRSYLSTASLGDSRGSSGPSVRTRPPLVPREPREGLRRSSARAPDRLRSSLDDAARTELDVARRQARELRGRLGL